MVFIYKQPTGNTQTLIQLTGNTKTLIHRALDKRGYWGLFKDSFFLFLDKKIFCDLSLQSSWRESSNDGSQHTFQSSNTEIIPKLSLLSLFIWSMEYSLLVPLKAPKMKIETNIDPDEWLTMSCLIWLNTVYPPVFDFSVWYSMNKTLFFSCRQEISLCAFLAPQELKFRLQVTINIPLYKISLQTWTREFS